MCRNIKQLKHTPNHVKNKRTLIGIYIFLKYVGKNCRWKRSRIHMKAMRGPTKPISAFNNPERDLARGDTFGIPFPQQCLSRGPWAAITTGEPQVPLLRCSSSSLSTRALSCASISSTHSEALQASTLLDKCFNCSLNMNMEETQETT